MNSLSLIKHAVNRGLGGTILPSVAVADDVLSERFYAWEITEPNIQREVFLATNTLTKQSASISAVAKIATDILKKYAELKTI
ncbi:LysR substrate-binding domain-containing protein [Orrella sp. 11846]|uniref:LysR substrate-binding domain-containing protein n=1 Tax=Orrella sp. 11846 TaxID=3409913 RepID=UPI003B5C1734